MLNNLFFTVLKTVFTKLWQNSEEYPVKYYKKGEQYKLIDKFR